MAKRKRLGPAMFAGEGQTPQSEPVSAPPIARVAGEAAAEAAVRELGDTLARARAEGRLVQDIPLDQIDTRHLHRDRVGVSLEDQEALVASIAARGQQMPIEVVDLGPGTSPRYGLISGWRRLAALRRLAETEPDRFATALAVLRRPDGAAEAYLSMVEENEIRVGLSYYERAQVAARASDAGVFDHTEHAIQSLFPTASKAKRSKIKSFTRVYRVLDDVLAFPERIPERLGLRIAKALDEARASRTPGWFYVALRDAVQAAPPRTPDEEQVLLERLLAGKAGSEKAHRVESTRFPGGLELTRARGVVKLSGTGIDDALMRDLCDWLAARQADLG